MRTWKEAASRVRPLPPKRYPTVQAYMTRAGVPARVIQHVLKLSRRDKAIARAFMHGASVKRLARKHSLPGQVIEDILRSELFRQPSVR